MSVLPLPGKPDFILPVAISFLASIVVFLPIFFWGNFPLWSTDNLFGSYPTLEISRRQFLTGDHSWFPLAGMGIDFSASVNNLSYSPVFNLIFTLFKTTSATYIASGSLQFLCFFFVGVGHYYVTQNFVNNRSCAILSAAMYQLSFATLYYLQTFPNIILQCLFLLSIFIVQNSAKLNIIFLISLLTISLSTLLLTGHLVYSAYFLVAHLLITGYIISQLESKTLKLRLSVGYISAILLSAVIVQYRLIPFLAEVMGGSRIQGGFVYSQDIVRPLAFFRLFVPELVGVSLNKTSELGGMTFGHVTIASIIDFSNAQVLFVYSGAVGALLILFGLISKVARFWVIASWILLLEFVFPGSFGTLLNSVFYPFQHGSHAYLAPFFWSITAAITVANIQSLSQGHAVSEFLTRFLVLAIPILAGIVITISICLQVYGNLGVNIWTSKAIVISVAIACSILIHTILKARPLEVGSISAMAIVDHKRVIFVSSVVIVLACCAAYYATLVGRHVIVFLTSSIFVLGIWFPLIDKPHRENWTSGRLAIWVILFVGLIFGAWSLIEPFLPQLGAIDYPLDGYFRLSNEYGRQAMWRTEWLLIVFFALYKLYLVIFWIFRFVRGMKYLVGGLPLALLVVVIADQLPAFLEFSRYSAKPFVRVNYDELFRPLDKLLQSDEMGYRIGFVNKALPITPLFDYRAETEVLSNMPYAYGYRSYGGVNSQLPKRQSEFLTTWVEDRTLKDDILPNTAIDEIGVATNFTDETLLKLFGVRYLIEGQLGAPVEEPKLVVTIGAYNIVHFKELYYGIPHSAGPLNLKEVKVPSQIPGAIVGSSVGGVMDTIEERLVESTLEPRLLATIRNYSVVFYKGRYFGIPQSVGSLDLSGMKNPERIPGVVAELSLSKMYCTLEQLDGEVPCQPENVKIGFTELPEALSRIMIYGDYVVARDVKEAARMVRDEEVDLSKQVIVEQNLHFQAIPETFSKRLKYEEMNSDFLRINLTPAQDARILLFNDSYNVGWTATVDGVEQKVFPANGIFMGTIVPAGAKSVELKFKPRWQETLIRIHRIGLFVLGLLLLVGLFKQMGGRVRETLHGKPLASGRAETAN